MPESLGSSLDKNQQIQPAGKSRRHSLRRAVPRTLSFTFLATGLAEVLLAIAILAGFSTRLEDKALTERLGQFSVFLDRETEELSLRAATYSAWDAMYYYMAHPDPAFVASNFRPDLLANEELDFVLLVDTQGKLLWHGSSAILDATGTAPRIPVDFSGLEDPLSGHLTVQGHPAVFTAAPITDDEEELPPRGTLVFVRLLDTHRIDGFMHGPYSPSFVVEIPVPSAASGVSLPPASPDRRTARRYEGMDLVGYQSFASPSGESLGYWRIPQERVWTIASHRIGYVVALAILVTSILVYLLVAHYVSRRIIRPIEMIKDHLDAFSEDMRVDGPLAFESGDELGDLARHLDLLVARVVQQTEALDRLAGTDGLTGIPNRRRLDACLEALRHRVPANERRLDQSRSATGFALFDVDFFKRYNDRYGHASGDEVLRKVAAALGRSVRGKDDLVSRYGGEEFAILIHGTDLAGMLVVAERARQAVEALAIEHAESDAARIVTISVGVAVASGPGFDPTALIAEADAELYRAKHEGRNRVCARPST